MFEPIGNYANRIGHTPLVRFIESSRAIHEALGINTELVEYDATTATLRASLEISKLHTGTVYNNISIMYGIVIAAFTDMITGAAGYLRAGETFVVNHQETRIKYLKHVHIQEGTKLFTEIVIPKVRRVGRYYYCVSTITQIKSDGTGEKIAEIWTKISSMLEKVFEKILKKLS